MIWGAFGKLSSGFGPSKVQSLAAIPFFFFLSPSFFLRPLVREGPASFAEPKESRRFGGCRAPATPRSRLASPLGLSVSGAWRQALRLGAQALGDVDGADGVTGNSALSACERARRWRQAAGRGWGTGGAGWKEGKGREGAGIPMQGLFDWCRFLPPTPNSA